MGSIFKCLINFHPNVAQKLGAGIKVCPSVGRVTPTPTCILILEASGAWPMGLAGVSWVRLMWGSQLWVSLGQD